METGDPGRTTLGQPGRDSTFSIRGLTSPIIGSIEGIAALCGMLPTLNERQTCSASACCPQRRAFTGPAVDGAGPPAGERMSFARGALMLTRRGHASP